MSGFIRGLPIIVMTGGTIEAALRGIDIMKNRWAFVACSFSAALSLIMVGCSKSEPSSPAAAASEPVPSEEGEQVAEEREPEKAPPEEEKNDIAAEQTVYEVLKPKDEVVTYITAAEIDKKDIEDCLFNLSGHPFDLTSGTLSYRRIEFDKITGTLAIALNDDKPTAQPQIVLVRALETIGSELIFHLMNPNAYYCFKNVDDVGTDYELHLHCQARVSENIRWTDSKYQTALSAAIEESGVYLSPNKTKKLTHEKPKGATCLNGR